MERNQTVGFQYSTTSNSVMQTIFTVGSSAADAARVKKFKIQGKQAIKDPSVVEKENNKTLVKKLTIWVKKVINK